MKRVEENIKNQVEDLKKNGEHFKAAELFLEHENFHEAGEIFESLFSFPEALDAYERGNHIRDAFRIILKSGSEEDLNRIVNRAVRVGETEWLLNQLEETGRFDLSGRVYRACGEIQSAASRFEKADLLFDAAQARLELGDLRKAGMLLEKHISKNQNDALAYFYLGRILASFTQFKDAIHYLQQAILHHADKDLMYDMCAPVMIVCFSRLHYTKAAQIVLNKWQTIHRGQNALPRHVEDFLESDRAKVFSDTLVFSGVQEENHRENKEQSEKEAQEQTLFGGRYILGESSRAGAVGQVFRAYDAFLGQSVALKVFSSQATESSMFARYGADVQSAGLLQHPATPVVLEFNEQHGFLVTDWFEGTPIDAYSLKETDFNWLLSSVGSILSLLGAAHRIGLIHGTINPHSILVAPLKTVVVGFGEHHLAQIRSTETGGHQSRWPYLSPEQMIGHQFDVRSDVYGVGAVLFRVLMGTPPPLQDTRESTTLADILEKEKPRLGEDWVRFFQKALAVDRTERFEDCSMMNAALPKVVPEMPAITENNSRLHEEGLTVEQDAQRYEKYSLFKRGENDLKIFEGMDTLLARCVWLVQVKTDEELKRLQVCASIPVGIQPVYDIRPSLKQCVVARDEEGTIVEIDRLRFVPQSFLRDLARVAQALERMHQHGLMLGETELDRWLGPFGPRIRLAPCALPLPLNGADPVGDWIGFEKMVCQGFCIPWTQTDRVRKGVTDQLIDEHYLTAEKAASLKNRFSADTPWHVFLAECSNTVVNTSSDRMAGQVLGSMINEEERA